ncbi:TonB-linked SusC/RagA family outer membrane protein [Dyadobacter jejuensis]|uniref:TonB-linked SusC/RagA family outer membrane protein n=1 Tax=Dyadobacter jejuensis TaxID=1082580 RepID=A0A316ASJ9_9BACT|nr:SusC/RagA family TonB-linked outer membrane protein [Dyadobacter jejuensis]PWJ60234.1 TonB-linked SusC/RagA family outer membrane protein [Dyadobacter jejuensis]
MKEILPKILVVCFLGLSQIAFSQSVATEISGTVTIAKDNTPLPGVSISIQGSTQGTLTDQNGRYHLAIPNPNTVLVFSSIGFATRQERVGNRKILDITLEEDTKSLEEVVVTALGISREKKALGYASQTVNSEELIQNKQTNIVNALQGKVAGVTITSTGGAPGQGAQILIRGINSIDVNRDNQPLFVIDGILMDNSTSTVGQSAELRGMSNRAADINPEDVETINILKGGAATALYGLRGANGVVVITTKSGKSGALRAHFSSTYGTEAVNHFPEVQDKYTIGYAGVYNPQDFFPSWGPTVEEARKIDPTHPEKLYNHFKDAYKKGQQFQNNLSFSGGTDKVTFMSSFSQLHHEGVIPFTDYDKYSIRLNTQVKFSDKFTTSTNLNFINSGGDRYNADRFSESLSYWSPRYDVRDYVKADGTMNTYGNNNPIYGASTNKLKDNVNRLIGEMNFNYTPWKWLNLNYRVGLDTYDDNRLRTAPGPRGFADERVYEDNDLGFVYQYTTSFRSLTSTLTASATSNLGKDLKGTLRVGHDLYDRQSRSFGSEGNELTVYNYFDLRNAKTITPTQSAEDYRLMGIFGELTLDYKNYLYLTLTGRNDITSSLRKPNNSFFYPSASIGYVFSQHLSLPPSISLGKLRASYAKIGKDALPYSTTTGFASYTNLPGGITGFTRGSLLGDPNLRPEFTETYEAGLELGFFGNRLGLDLTLYQSLSKDQIINVAVSSSTGYEKAAINSGTMRNRGVELILKGSPVRSAHFSWNASLNFAANRNKVLSIREGLTEITYASQYGYSGSTVTMRLIPGESYGNMYGTSHQRYYASGTVEDPRHIDQSLPMVIGANGFPVRNSNQKLIGNSLPKWTAGFNNAFQYKDFSLSVLFDARVGQDRYNQLSNFFSAFGIAKYTENRNETKVFEGVLADGTPNTKAVFLGQGKGPDGAEYGNGYYRNVHRGISENFVEDASWVRLRSLRLAYSLPKTLLDKGILKTVELSVTGNNLWLGTKYSGYDPETSSNSSGSNVDGFSGFTYPAVRSFLFSLNVGF